MLQQRCLCHHLGRCTASSIVPLSPNSSQLTQRFIFTQEMFIQHLTEEAHAQAKLERKPRRNIQYKDVGTLARLFQLSSFPSFLPEWCYMTFLTNSRSQCHITPRQPRIPRGRRPQNYHLQKGQGCRPGSVSGRGRRRCRLSCGSSRHSKWQQEQSQRSQGSSQRSRQSRHQPLHTVPPWRGKQQERGRHHRAGSIR